MTLLQLKYIVTVAAAGTISEAAKQLYIAQPSLTSAIKELENELGITIFKRTNKGILLSAEGEEFLGYARQVIEQTNLIEERYLGKTPVKHQFCVSTQHYSFAVEAFVELLKQYGGEEYDFRIRETQTYELIEDVAKLRSEVGVGAGHAQCRAPLAGAGLGGHAGQTLLLGVVGLSDGGVQLVTAGSPAPSAQPAETAKPETVQTPAEGEAP